MVSADRVPIWFAGWNALELNRVVSTLGLTGSPLRLIVLAIVKCLCAFEHQTVMRSKLTAPTVDPVGPQEPPALLRFAYRKALHEAARVPPMDYRDNPRLQHFRW